MSAMPEMTPEAIRAWKARLDFAAARIALEYVGTATDPAQKRAIAEALEMEERSRVWRSEIDRKRAAGIINGLKSQCSSEPSRLD